MKNTEYWYELIDGNWTRHPAAWCHYHKGYLTEKLMKTHKCKSKNCRRLDFDLERNEAND